ncbi:hypothetical protein MRB53_019815 [Persea americana]|uniref:Uncharacterized protein n=1 Tax=Persea americana TaxID=3435 RepID=A0ACC2KZE7_PERAE|nr:hypothetical protein MRB53_019815 [Persea americana]
MNTRYDVASRAPLLFRRSCSPHDRHLLSPLNDDDDNNNIFHTQTSHHRFIPSSIICRCVGEKERAMALLVNMVAARFSYSPSMERLTKTENPISLSPPTKRSTASVVRAEANQPINPVIRKEEAKVVDSVLVAELSKPLTAYCRCWRSGTFPLCDGSHVKHNKATGDNVGPLLVKKQE